MVEPEKGLGRRGEGAKAHPVRMRVGVLITADAIAVSQHTPGPERELEEEGRGRWNAARKVDAEIHLV